MSSTVADALTVLVLGVVALAGGGLLTTLVFRQVDRGDHVAPTDEADSVEAAREVLRGGAWIGVLERAAVAATLLVGSAEGLVVVLAVKGLGRYAELRAPAAAERFILGTLASALWAAACVGVAVLLRG